MPLRFVLRHRQNYNQVRAKSVSDQLVIAGRAFSSRLIVGTGKYRSFPEMARAHAASGADMVTVAVRRVNLTDKSKESLLDYIPRDKMFILPNTAACYTTDEAMRDATLAGRKAFLAGRMPKRLYASASSPLTGVVR